MVTSKKKKTINLPLRVDDELKKKIQKAADDDGRSINNWCVMVLEKAVKISK